MVSFARFGQRWSGWGGVVVGSGGVGGRWFGRGDGGREGCVLAARAGIRWWLGASHPPPNLPPGRGEGLNWRGMDWGWGALLLREGRVRRGFAGVGRQTLGSLHAVRY